MLETFRMSPATPSECVSSDLDKTMIGNEIPATIARGRRLTGTTTAAWQTDRAQVASSPRVAMQSTAASPQAWAFEVESTQIPLRQRRGAMHAGDVPQVACEPGRMRQE